MQSLWRCVPAPNWGAERALLAPDPVTALAILGALPPTVGCAVDVGCGTGTHLALLSRRAGSVIGLERDAGAAGRANARTTDRPTVVLRADAPHWPLSAACCEFVLALGILPHLAPDALTRTLAEIARALRPGGVALLHFWDVADWRAGAGRPWHEDDAPSAAWGFADAAQIEVWLAGVGLRAVSGRRRRIQTMGGEQVDYLMQCERAR